MNKRTFTVILSLLALMLCLGGCNQRNDCKTEEVLNYGIADMVLRSGERQALPAFLSGNGSAAVYELSQDGIVEIQDNTIVALATDEPATVEVTVWIECISKTFTVQVLPSAYYSVNVTQVGGTGTVTGLNADGYQIGDEVRLTITPPVGHFMDVTVNGQTMTLTDNELVFTMEGTTSVEISYRTQARVTVNNGSTATVSGITDGLYTPGTELTLNISHTDYQMIPTVTVNGDPDRVLPLDLNGGNSYSGTFTMTEDTVLSVSCANYSYRGSANDTVMAARRDTVVNAGLAMANTMFDYSDALDFSAGTVSYNFGSTHKLSSYHRGMLYAAGGNSLQAFIATCCDDAVTDGTTTVYPVKAGTLIGASDAKDYWAFAYGASCADLVYWAWSTISNTILFVDAQGMVEANGVYKVGDYTYQTQETEVAGTALPSQSFVNTITDCTNNSENVMNAAYAQLQPGAALVRYDGASGHAILVTEVSTSGKYIKYCDLNGAYNTYAIDGLTASSHSYLPSTNEGAGYHSFSQLFSKGFLPVTCKELLTSQDPVETFTVTDNKADSLNSNNLLKGMLESSYYISHVEMQILDTDGNVIQSAVRATMEGCWRNGGNSYKSAWTDLTGESYPENAKDVTHWQFYLAQFGSQFNFVWSEQTGEDYKVYTLDNTIQTDALASGNYTCIVTAYDANGKPHNVRNFNFTV